MGLPRPPAFLDPSLTEDMILESGVNYASGGGGILNETGGLFVSISRTMLLAKSHFQPIHFYIDGKPLAL